MSSDCSLAILSKMWRLFKNYEKVQTEIVRLLYEGLDIMDIITNYSNIGHSKEEYSKRVICA